MKSNIFWYYIKKLKGIAYNKKIGTDNKSYSGIDKNISICYNFVITKKLLNITKNKKMKKINKDYIFYSFLAGFLLYGILGMFSIFVLLIILIVSMIVMEAKIKEKFLSLTLRTLAYGGGMLLMYVFLFLRLKYNF